MNDQKPKEPVVAILNLPVAKAHPADAQWFAPWSVTIIDGLILVRPLSALNVFVTSLESNGCWNLTFTQ